MLHREEQKRDRSQFVTKSIGTKVTFSQDTQSFPYVFYDVKTRRDYKKSSLICLISNNYWTDKSTYVSSFCLNHAEKLQRETSPETAKGDSIVEDSVLEQERWYH